MVVVLPETTEQVADGAALLPRSTASRSCRAAPAPRCRAARCRSTTACCSAWRKFNRIREIDYDNRVVVAEPGVTNLAITKAVADRGLLLRARSVVADRLHHRRQCRGEFRRRALPEIRHDHQQCARRRDGADDRRDRPPRRQAPRCRRLRPARHRHRLGRPARRRHRGHGAHPEEAGDRARAAGRLSELRGCRRLRVAHHRRRHHPGRHGDDGQAGDPRHRGVCPCRLSARRRGAADRRARWAAGRGRSPDRAGRGDRARIAASIDAAGLDIRGRAAAVLGRPQGGVPGGGPHLAGLLLHGRHDPARQAAAGAETHPRAVASITACASPTCFMPATATCIR